MVVETNFSIQLWPKLNNIVVEVIEVDDELDKSNMSTAAGT